MDDVAGCRLIFPDIVSMMEFRTKLHKANFEHKRKNDPDKYNYISKPKSTGYRGVHDIYEYDVRSKNGKNSKGLLIELQYRTVVQHAWETAVEVIGFITLSQPKFQEGDKRYEIAMSYASEILARTYEQSKSCFADLSDADLLQNFVRIDYELGLMSLLKRLNAADSAISSKRNVILIFSEMEELETRSFSSATEAIRVLFEMEQANPGKDIVLFRADTSDDVRIAFRNYFSDAREFIRLVEHGCEILAGNKLIHLDLSDSNEIA